MQLLFNILQYGFVLFDKSVFELKTLILSSFTQPWAWVCVKQLVNVNMKNETKKENRIS